MADSSVPITAGTGTNIDTFTQAGGDHRQAMVLGDAVNADVAGVANGGLGVNGGTLVSTSGAIAAAGTGTVGPLNVATSGNVTFTIKNTVAASAWAGAPVVVFEQSDDNTSWASLPVVRNDTGQVASTFTLGPGVASGSLMFDAAVEGVTYVRARVTTGPTTNGLTVVIDAGGMPFPQGHSVLSVPIDGHRATYVGQATAFTPHVVLTGPFLVLANPSTTKIIRVLRARLELTLATAALLAFQCAHSTTALSTGGTATAGGVGQMDWSDPTAVGTVNGYTAVPSNPTAAAVAVRRQWVGLATAAGAPAVTELLFGSGRPGKAVILRPNQQLHWSWTSAPATAVSANYEFEWTEEPV